MTLLVIFVAAICLAYANGANDNFKGVATLFGSGTTSYRNALLWATVATLLGSLAAILLAEQLLQSFSGRGLVSNDLVADPRYLAAVGLGASLTVLIATRLGMPISTTHGLVGALVGAGLVSQSNVDFSRLQTNFFAPLLMSPLISLAATCVCYPAFRGLRHLLGITHETCFCVGNEVIEVAPALSKAAALQRMEQLSMSVGTKVTCHCRYNGQAVGIEAATILDWLHFLSSGIVSFARGLNDTPKIAALLLLIPYLGPVGGLSLVGLTIAVGGILSARRVAETMSKKITPMSHGQGFTANLITGMVVIAASRLGMPVSTTHVSCGALFGISAVTRQGHWGIILKIVTAWVTTLPVAAALGAAIFWILSAL